MMANLKWVNGDAVQLSPEEQAEYDAYVAKKSEPKPRPLNEQLNEDFKTLPPEARAQFFVHKAAVKLALEEGDTEAAELLISGVTVPPELEPVKAKMLGKFKK